MLQTVNQVARTLDQLVGSTERGFREIRDTLTNHYVPRDELAARFAALEGRTGAIESARAAEAEAARETERQAARDRRTDRWQRIALAVGTTASLAGTAAGVYIHFH